MNESKKYWRSLEDLEQTPEFKEWVEKEFPDGIADATDGVSRRKFLAIMAASFAFAGLSACRRPVEKLVPYVKSPDADIIPGQPMFYATTMPFGIDSYPLLVKSNEGRPTKVEGNIKHPLSNGGTNIYAQASILNLYDPDRVMGVKQGGADSTWDDFLSAWRDGAKGLAQGQGLALLVEPFNSPTLKRLLNDFKKTYPKSVVSVYEPYGTENVAAGCEIALGVKVFPLIQYDKANIILSLDADIFTANEALDINASSGFSIGRKMISEKDEMNRLYVVEGNFSTTGSVADHRLSIASSQMGAFVNALITELKSQGCSIGVAEGMGGDFDKKFIKAVAKDLLKHKGGSIVVAGQGQSAAIHAMVVAINEGLGNVEKTVSYKPLPNAEVSSVASLKNLVSSMNGGAVNTLVIMGGNPAYNAPADFGFAEAMKKVKTVIRYGEYNDETSKLSAWVLPSSHYLEGWGDVQALDGTTGIIQPLIAPLFDTKNAIEVLDMMSSGNMNTSYEAVRETWKSESNWKGLLHDGFAKNSAHAGVSIKLNSAAITQAVANAKFSSAAPSINALEIIFTPSYTIYDGKYANNGWLQELPETMTKIAWDNAAVISVKTAKELKIKTDFSISDVMSRQMLEVSVGGKTMQLPVWVLPGQKDYTVRISLGYGREKLGRVANGIGVNVYPLRTSANMTSLGNASIKVLNKNFTLATTQNHGSMEGRPIIAEATLEEYRKKPTFAMDEQEGLQALLRGKVPVESLWDDVYDYKVGNQWGMVIDLNLCTGCNACTIACQSENNIPIVGKEQTAKGRQMQWIRIDRYFTGSNDNPEAVFQPVACHHCENAPCEQVCPVTATLHTEDGLNAMVYNRCVGTRYCANNCPYKVRRFNYFNYATDNPVYEDMPEVMKMAQNPEVTVRFRGVMEKCSYCSQRISNERISKKNKGEKLKDGDIITACQQVCPTEAIIFGDINDEKSRVSQAKKRNRNYEMLAELNVKPRTSYLAKLRNTNEELTSNT